MITWLKTTPIRLLYFIALLFLVGLVAFALYLQYRLGIEPCPLCILQRLVFIAMAVVCLVAAIHNPGRFFQRVYACSFIMLGMLGSGLAMRHVWIEHLPHDQIPSCGPSWDVLINNFPLLEALQVILRGSADCATVTWQFLGLSTPSWALIAFVFLTSMALYLVVLRQQANQ